MSYTAFIFPAFTLEYIGREVATFEKLSGQTFDDYLINASAFLQIKLTDFDIDQNNYLNDELKNQYFSYLFSCSYSDLLKQKHAKAAYLAGFSMGIYAAFYHAGCYAINDGLLLIKSAYESISAILQGGLFGMCTIIGLDREEISGFIDGHAFKAEIVNINGYQSFGIAGSSKDIDKLIELAVAEGAIHTARYAIQCPYHSGFAKNAGAIFSKSVEKLEIRPPKIPVISSIDQEKITTVDQVRDELLKNLVSPLNWLVTMEKLIYLNVNELMECGAGKSLYKLGKFIDGEFKIYPVNKWDRKLVKNDGD